ncbi:hypothetical protein BayCH28_22310 [Mycolicibacterium sp. CH28]|uniref:hypothetical protein n=1 Tax=Mycolicibacterium sp. CH28 TaxID=2512237 RepID=UPI001080FF92|nr:hypothetical protein [Mycolicibacterium sp. CH28]TGD85137.1 hypothetical protein BayCH28_22310 [Mycolicibacterium sp. CH28]
MNVPTDDEREHRICINARNRGGGVTVCEYAGGPKPTRIRLTRAEALRVADALVDVVEQRDLRRTAAITEEEPND